MYCPKCGTENFEGYAFCVKCGSSLPSTPVDQQSSFVEPPAPTNDVYSAPAEPVQPQIYPVVETPAPKVDPTDLKNDKQRPLIPVVVLSGISLFYLFVVFVYDIYWYSAYEPVYFKFGEGFIFNSGLHYMIVFTSFSLILIAGIITKPRIRSILGGTAMLSFGLYYFIKFLTSFRYITDILSDFEYIMRSFESMIYYSSELFHCIMYVPLFILFLVGGILFFINFKGKVVRILACVAYLLTDLIGLFAFSLQLLQSHYYSTMIVNYAFQLISFIIPVTILVFCITAKNPKQLK